MDCLLFVLWALSLACAFLAGVMVGQQQRPPSGNGGEGEGNGERVTRAAL